MVTLSQSKKIRGHSLFFFCLSKVRLDLYKKKRKISCYLTNDIHVITVNQMAPFFSLLSRKDQQQPAHSSRLTLIIIHKCLYSRTFINKALPNYESEIQILFNNFPPLYEVITCILCVNLQCPFSEYFLREFRQFWSPSLVVGNKMISSAYIKPLIAVFSIYTG